MDKRFFVRGYREKAKSLTFYDPEPYTLPEAMSKANEYLIKIRRLEKIMLFERGETDEKKAVI
ncbi:MAG: hypothetical protein KAU46_04470 [Candidatus Aminicenantes bacterium]|nr:hypothetical protein [Candidatus Aminicenantes bacterium]